jgi:hypothetical protein
MQYKFYIYKQNVIYATFNKYDLSQYTLLREIQQNGKWGLKIERDKEFFTVIRTKFSGSVKVKGTDFDALIALEGSQLQYAVIIHQLCAGVYVEKWKGFFSYFDFKVDLDTCYLEFEPAPWDVYTPIFDQMDVERNILFADSDFSMQMERLEWPFEEAYKYYVLSGSPTLISWWAYGSGEYYMYSNYSYYHIDEYGVPYYDERFTFRRDYGLTESAVTPPTPNPGGNWVYLEEISTGVHKWIRPYLNSVYQTPYSYVTLGDDVYQELQTSLGTNIYLFGLKRLSKVFEYYATQMRLTYESHFFNDTPCPMGGDSLDWTMIQQISNLRYTEDQATKGILKLKDFLSWIRDTFNVYWYIDAAGDWRFEHRMYFDLGLSYTVPAGVVMDLSVLYPDNIKHLSKYEWSKPELFRYEKLDIPYSNFTDWVNAGIEYTQLSILGNTTDTKTVGWGTDVISMYDIREELGKTGWVLYNVSLDGAFYKVVNTVGAISGNSIQNGRFSTANLMRDLWTYGRLLSTGKVNGVQTTFDSIERLRKQKELSFPQCCQTIDYNGLFRTDLGDGLMDSAEYEAETGTLKVQLIYE